MSIIYTEVNPKIVHNVMEHPWSAHKDDQLIWLTHQTIILVFCLFEFLLLRVECHLQSLVLVQQCLVCLSAALQLFLQVFYLPIRFVMCLLTVSDPRLEQKEVG